MSGSMLAHLVALPFAKTHVQYTHMNKLPVALRTVL
jgi:hypothetical protein